jgi:tetratricopeptide (TPR) repeat protein
MFVSAPKSLLAVLLLIGLGCAPTRPIPDQARDTLQGLDPNILLLTPPSLSEEERARELFLRALYQEAMGNWEAAQEGYEKALALAPEEPGILHALAQLLARRGQLRQAIGYAEQAVRLDSIRSGESSARWYRGTLAELYAQAGLSERAVREYEHLLGRFRRDEELWLELAELYRRLNRPEKALAVLDTLLRLRGPEPGLLETKFLLLEQLGRQEEALALLRSWWQEEPHNGELRRQLLHRYLRAGRAEEALRLLEEAGEQDPEVELDRAELLEAMGQPDSARKILEALLNSPRLDTANRLRLGALLYERARSGEGDVQGILGALETLWKNDPESAELAFWLGDLKARLGQSEEALDLLRRAIKLDVRNPEAWLRAVQVALQARNPDLAIELGEEALELFPGQSAILLLLGSAYLERGRPQQAISRLEAALELETDSTALRALLLGTLADAYAQTGPAQRADSLYQAALVLDPENPVLLNNYAYHLAETGRDLEGALQMALRAVEKEPDNPSFLDTLGWIYFQMGRYTEAIAWLERAVATGQASAVVLEHLGDAYARVGRMHEARNLWQQALERDPDNARLRQKLGNRGG